jgi:hypothetical protein
MYLINLLGEPAYTSGNQLAYLLEAAPGPVSDWLPVTLSGNPLLSTDVKYFFQLI